MRTTEERVAAVNRRVQEINRQKQRRTIFLAAGTVLAFAAIAALIPVRAKEELWHEKTNVKFDLRPGALPGPAARHGAGGG